MFKKTVWSFEIFSRYFVLLKSAVPEISTLFSSSFSLRDKSGIAKSNIQRWIPIVAASQLTKGIEEEKEDVEVGYCISFDNWNKGLATEAFSKVIEYLFNEVDVKTITASHDSRNIASGKVMEKCGLKYIETQDFVNKGENILLKVYKRNK